MFEADSVTHIFRVTRHIGAVATGLIADARSLISRARHEASEYAYKHAHPIPIDLLARRIANLNQLSTQEAGMRPIGVALTLIGIDEERGGPKVIKIQEEKGRRGNVLIYFNLSLKLYEFFLGIQV